jgi:hypothetical protein
VVTIITITSDLTGSPFGTAVPNYIFESVFKMSQVPGTEGINNSGLGYDNRLMSQAEQRLYIHLLDLVQAENPEQMIGRMRSLFIEGIGYPDGTVLTDLDSLVLSKQAEEEFRFVLNRCIHILTNRWQGRPQNQGAVLDLVQLFEESPTKPPNEYARARAVRRQRDLMKQFLETEQYAALRRLGNVMAQSQESHTARPLGELIRRYPYLYSHCLVSEGSTQEYQQSVRTLQEQVQRKYEFDLSQYVTYQVRRSQLLQSSSENTVGRILHPVKNPTLLEEADFRLAVRQFAGKASGGMTHRDRAVRFLNQANHQQSFGSYKRDLYEYLMETMDQGYGQRQFKVQLAQQLKDTLSDQDDAVANEFLVMRTCSQLLNFLVVESPQKPKHFLFVDLISNIGPTMATALLLKIALVCRKVRPYLEKRFSILFNHYESYSSSSVAWLVAMMENLNIALSTNFGQMNLAFVHQI